MDSTIQAFRKASDPRDPFTRVILSLWADLNWTRNNRADLLPQLSPVLTGGVNTEDWSRELRVLDAEQPWRNCWIDAPAEHPYNTTYAPCNSEAPVFVPASMTRQAVISGIAVDQSLADADLVAPWIAQGSAVSEIAGDASAEVVEEGSADAEITPVAPAEAAEALDEGSFSFASAEIATSFGAW
ncbi:hypothetical protein PHMEG_00038291, partial [Phytophthora megakarya]